MITGRDLINYILTNHLENEPIFKDGKPIGFLTVEEAAVKLKVGTETVKVLFNVGFLPGMRIGETIYIFGDYEAMYSMRGVYEKSI